MVFVWSHLTDGDPAYTLVQVSVNDLLMLLLFAPIVRFLVSGASSLHVPFQVLLYSVFVWSYLSDGDPAYTLVQVSVNDLIMLVLFAPIVQLLVSGASSLEVPFVVLLYSVVVFIVIPLAAGVVLRHWFVRRHGQRWFEDVLLPRFAPVSMAALLATLVLIFAFQAENITGRTLHVALIAVPILIQVYFNASLAYGLMRLLRVEYSVAAPGALIGASNFFELAVATAIALFGPESGAALATVVGVLIEVPVMLSVCSVCNRTRHWFPAPVRLSRLAP